MYTLENTFKDKKKINTAITESHNSEIYEVTQTNKVSCLCTCLFVTSYYAPQIKNNTRNKNIATDI